MALDWALGEASQTARHRYAERGRRMGFNPDLVTLTGSSWLSGKLRLTYTSSGDLTVRLAARLAAPVEHRRPSSE